MSILLKEKISDTLGGFREFMQNNQALMIVICMVVLCGAVAYMVISGMNSSTTSPRQTNMEVPYKDLTTGKVFMGSRFDMSPIQSPDGNDAVRVVFFQCDGGDKFIGYYEKYSQNYKDLQAKAQGDPSVLYEMEQTGRGILFHSFDDGKTWIDVQTPEYEKARDKKLICPDGKYAMQLPGM